MISAPLAAPAYAPALPAAPMITPAPATGPTITPPTPEKIEKKPMSQTAAPATIIVSLPADAKLMIDETLTTSTSDRRVFVSPNLNAGKEYHYNLKATFVQDGKTVELTKRVAVIAGNETTVSFEAPVAAAVAGR